MSTPDPEETEREALATLIREELAKDLAGFGSCDFGLTLAGTIQDAGFRRLPESDSRARLEQVWSALGCAPNLDAFKPAVQQAMWKDALSMITDATARDSRVYRENQELIAEVERLRLAESEIRREPITDAEVDAVAHVMFEPPTGGSGDYTWAEMVREDPTRADMWRTDARAALEAARAVKEADRV